MYGLLDLITRGAITVGLTVGASTSITAPVKAYATLDSSPAAPQGASAVDTPTVPRGVDAKDTTP